MCFTSMLPSSALTSVIYHPSNSLFQILPKKLNNKKDELILSSFYVKWSMPVIFSFSSFVVLQLYSK